MSLLKLKLSTLLQCTGDILYAWHVKDGLQPRLIHEPHFNRHMKAHLSEWHEFEAVLKTTHKTHKDTVRTISHWKQIYLRINSQIHSFLCQTGKPSQKDISFDMQNKASRNCPIILKMADRTKLLHQTSSQSKSKSSWHRANGRFPNIKAGPSGMPFFHRKRSMYACKQADTSSSRIILIMLSKKISEIFWQHDEI